MLIKIKVVLILYFSLLKILFRKYKFHKKIKEIEEGLLFKYFNSNHPRRSYLIYNQHLFFYQFLPKSLKEINVKYDNINQKFFLSQKYTFLYKNIDIYYIGDSHTEFYSRSKCSKNDFLFSNKKTIWLGPKTIIGLKFENSAYEILNIINANLKISKNKKVYLLFSLGSIDVRCSIYEFFLRKIILDNEQLNKLILESIEYIYENMFKMLLKNPNIINIGFFELFNASNNYYEPKTLQEIKSIKQDEFFPTFGESNVRQEWTNQFNNVIKNFLMKKKIDFINTNEFLSNDKMINLSEDGIHITSEDVIHKINKKINDNFNLKYAKSIN